jgi:hypothetical protein
MFSHAENKAYCMLKSHFTDAKCRAHHDYEDRAYLLKSRCMLIKIESCERDSAMIITTFKSN